MKTLIISLVLTLGGIVYAAQIFPPIRSGSSGSSGVAWTSFTPTFVGFGTVVNPHFVYSLDAHNTLHIRGNGTTGTVEAVALTFTLPNGFLVDYTKEGTTPSGHNVGELVYVNNGADAGIYPNNYVAIAFIDGTTTDKVYFALQAGSNVYVKNHGSSVVASDSYFDMNISVIVQ